MYLSIRSWRSETCFSLERISPCAASHAPVATNVTAARYKEKSSSRLIAAIPTVIITDMLAIADGSNFSQLKFIRISDNKEILSIKLNGGGSEAPLLIKDIDNNGKNELIIAANRKIYCYDFSKLKI